MSSIELIGFPDYIEQNITKIGAENPKQNFSLKSDKNCLEIHDSQGVVTEVQ